jgi:glyoxylase-like metal-dependent hydrolase (beta-lactamase superfamily II)
VSGARAGRPSAWTVRPIRTGVFEEAEVSFLFYMREEWGRKIPAVYWMFLLEDGRHRVLVDTGPASPEFGRRHHHDYTRTPEEEPVAALARLGVRPEQIDLVVNTHLHWDHCGHNDAFPNAIVYVQADELVEALHCNPSHRIFYTDPRAWPPWLRAIDRTVPLRGDAELLPGLRALHLPGHTDGFQGVLVETDRGRPIVIAGDAVPYLANLYPPDGGSPAISGIHMSGVREYYRTFERIRALDPLHVMPGNDPAIGERELYP